MSDPDARARAVRNGRLVGAEIAFERDKLGMSRADSVQQLAGEFAEFVFAVMDADLWLPLPDEWDLWWTQLQLHTRSLFAAAFADMDGLDEQRFFVAAWDIYKRYKDEPSDTGPRWWDRLETDVYVIQDIAFPESEGAIARATR